MYMTRPKSSKGRTRARVTQALAVEDEGFHQSHTFSPHPPPAPSATVVPPSAVPRRSCKPSSDVLTEIFERPPDVSVPSLNKYKVLPSIEKRPGDVSPRAMEDKASRLSLSDSRLQREKHILHLCSQTASKSDTRIGTVSENQCGLTEASNRGWDSPGLSESRIEGDEGEHLLLAIRTPCGRRFKCHFQPTDTLQDVVAAAEAKYREQYELALIETMEVPRRTFTDLTMRLSQCGILTKSVLCISFKDSTIDSD